MANEALKAATEPEQKFQTKLQ